MRISDWIADVVSSDRHHLCNLAGDHVPAEDRLRPPRPAVGHGEQHLIVPWPPLDVRDVLPGTQGRRTSDLPDGTGRGSYGKFHIWLLTALACLSCPGPRRPTRAIGVLPPLPGRRPAFGKRLCRRQIERAAGWE